MATSQVSPDWRGRCTYNGHGGGSDGIPPATMQVGLPGAVGFGVGVCPPGSLPPGFTPLSGYADPASPNYGNYQYSDGSVMVWIPKFFYRINHAANPTYSIYTPNDIHIVGGETFANRAAATAAGYALHRAFIDGGVEQPGFFVDKYQVSKNAKGTGFVGSSIRNGLPLSSSAAHNPVGDLTAVAGINANYAFLTAARARDGVDGAINASSVFFNQSVFMMSALAMLALAHGQAATGTAYCAWWSATTTNFPKGCNNNALRDTNDTTVVYQSDGYPNCGKTGSGALLAKTTHNGQDCGVCDVNGNMWQVLIGMTCIGSTKAITGVTLANPCVLTVVGHGLETGRIVEVGGIVGTTQLNTKIYTATVVDADHISLDGVDSTGYTAYASGGTLYFGTFYVAKEAARMRDFTAGNTLATDHWGATGVAAMMEEIPGVVVAAAGGLSCNQYFGNGANQVLSGDASGNGYQLASVGLAKDASGYSAAGTDLFGKDRLEQYIRNELCLLGCGYWSSGTTAGVWYRNLFHYRPTSLSSLGARSACYPV